LQPGTSSTHSCSSSAEGWRNVTTTSSSSSWVAAVGSSSGWRQWQRRLRLQAAVMTACLTNHLRCAALPPHTCAGLHTRQHTPLLGGGCFVSPTMSCWRAACMVNSMRCRHTEPQAQQCATTQRPPPFPQASLYTATTNDTNHHCYCPSCPPPLNSSWRVCQAGAGAGRWCCCALSRSCCATWTAST
jgi:hypothetical protein